MPRRRRARYRRNPFGIKRKTLYWIAGGVGVLGVGGLIYYFATRPSGGELASGGGGTLKLPVPSGGGTQQQGGGGGGGGSGGGGGPANPPAPPPATTNPTSPSEFFANLGKYTTQLGNLGYNYQQIFDTLNKFGIINMIRGWGIDLPTIQQILNIDLSDLSKLLGGVDFKGIASQLATLKLR